MDKFEEAVREEVSDRLGRELPDATFREYIESGAAAILTATAEIGSVNVADGFPMEEVANAVGAGISAAIKTALETAQDARGAAEDKEPAGGESPAAETPQEPAATVPGGPGETAKN